MRTESSSLFKTNPWTPNHPLWMHANSVVSILAAFTNPSTGDGLVTVGVGVYLGSNRVLTVAHLFKQPSPENTKLGIVVAKTSTTRGPVGDVFYGMGSSVKAKTLDSFPKRVGDTIPPEAFRNDLTQLVDFAVLELFQDIPDLHAMTPEIPSMDDRCDVGTSRELVVLTVNAMANVRKVLADYPSGTDVEGLRKNIWRLLLDQLCCPDNGVDIYGDEHLGQRG
ncbi:hypothetical protein EX30DRAFT_349643 [Ascodesmis nigricans]|uniref:Trypsin-like serine protease n=1 Tax=Ascodesmis nigricans TaxID=341454 RepID=A0A4S2MUK8_9PEZI|nr:hypothetical protein EX30DRAFT_349643 [Ascodesmis nigricans]